MLLPVLRRQQQHTIRLTLVTLPLSPKIDNDVQKRWEVIGVERGSFARQHSQHLEKQRIQECRQRHSQRIQEAVVVKTAGPACVCTARFWPANVFQNRGAWSGG